MNIEDLTPSEQAKSPVYFDTKTLAHYIHRSPGAIRNLVMRRAIPFRKPGGRLIFLKAEIDQWINISEGTTLDEILRNKA